MNSLQCRCLAAAWGAVTAVTVAAAEPAAAAPGFEVPPGFAVSLFADDALAHDIYSMTVDAHGRVVVAGPGYVKILHDDDGDGRAERAQLYSSRPAGGAHGLLFVGEDLICTGDNAVFRLHDADGDGTADGQPEVWASLRNPEHGANGLVQGPDGWIYLVCGNDAGVSEKQVTTRSSPVEHPQCGAIVRFSPDGRRQEVYAHGFRNPYDLDFNPAGQLFTVDSDGERDYHLPWYAPTRLFDVAAGRQHGWLLSGWQRSWNRPASFFDAVPRVAELGRGSPTGLVCYRHERFPERYQGGIFSACWTLGRVYYLPLEPAAASYRSQPEIFLRTTGETGFAPCDLAVGRGGELFVAIGGRRTLGSVFRVTYTGTCAAPPRVSAAGLDGVLAAPQPLAAWSRAVWEPAAKEFGREPFEQVVADGNRTPADRVRAVEVLVDVWGGLSDGLAARVVKDAPAAVKARLAWAMGRGATQDQDSLPLLVRLTQDADPCVLRAAWEEIASWDGARPEVFAALDWRRALYDSDRRVRAAAIAAARRTCRSAFDKSPRRSPAYPADQLAHLRVELGAESPVAADAFVQRALAACAADPTTGCRLEAVRLMQIGLGDVRLQPGEAEVFSGYRGNRASDANPQLRAQVAAHIARVFPVGDGELDRELARLAGMLGVENAELLEALSAQWSDESSTEDSLHYLIVTALVPGPRSESVTERMAHSLLYLERRLHERNEFASQNWPFRVAEMFDEACRRDAKLAERLVRQPEFGWPEHAVFAARMTGPTRAQAIRRLVAIGSQPEAAISSELVMLVAELPADESLPFLRRAWQEPGLRDAVALALARRPAAEDRPRLIEALASVQPNVVDQAAQALAALDGPATPDDLRAALAALRAACLVPEQTVTRRSLLDLLDHWTGSAVPLDESTRNNPAAVWAAWRAWLGRMHPGQLKRLDESGAVDLPAWLERLEKVDWTQGQADRGRRVFESKSCHRCHQASGQLGPDLAGAVTRMSRQDLFTAILDPNKEVSPAFQTTTVVTTAGQVYHGLVVYESPEGTLLQTGPDTTVRIVGADKSAMRPARQSLMPSGLLNGASDQDLADLLAYLKTLGKP